MQIYIYALFQSHDITAIVDVETESYNLNFLFQISLKVLHSLDLSNPIN